MPSHGPLSHGPFTDTFLGRQYMQENKRPSHDGGKIDVLLEGGPAGMPNAVQAERSTVVDRKLKIPYCGGYEHFELVGDSGDLSRVIFRWTMRTRIAE
ncbi:DUF5988 family protein [Streptomyces smyrnaeus]|uniref:DUF5988 family protein n=2 Tax=Streptomyces smyrnaeus TaxID=1387713 RepID=UPI0027DE8C05|nr:DUF5988 family protein [Streptomyces smyrnaeus]